MVLENCPWYMLVWGQDQEVCQAAVVFLQCFLQIVDFMCQTRDASLLQQGTLRILFRKGAKNLSGAF